MVEPDGTRRIVQYTADSINGFNAIVSKEPLTHILEEKAPIRPHVRTTLVDAKETPIITQSPIIAHQPVVVGNRNVVAHAPLLRTSPIYLSHNNEHLVTLREPKITVTHHPVAVTRIHQRHEPIATTIGHAPVAVTRLEHHPIAVVSHAPVATEAITHVEHHPIAIVH